MKNKMSNHLALAVALSAMVGLTPLAIQAGETPSTSASADSRITDARFRGMEIQGIDVAYREAGDPSNPAVVLLHGFPTSSHMFRELIPQLADKYHIIAPDYPGFGASAMPALADFDYSFANFADVVNELLEKKSVDQYAMYLMGYGAPLGFRLFAKHPERVTGFIIQNGNAYDEGLEEFWDPIKTYWADASTENREKLRGEEVMLHVGEHCIDVFYQGKGVAQHPRAVSGQGGHTTNVAHMPKAHAKHQEWTPSRFLNWASQVGVATQRVVRYQLESRPHPEHGYRACLGILNLAKKYGNPRLENACLRAEKIGGLHYKNLASILKTSLDKLPIETDKQQTLPITHSNVRGSDYYH